MSENVCASCGQVFSTYSNLKRHLRKIHLIENNRATNNDEGKCVRCEICTRTFTSNSTMGRHMRTVHNTHSKVEKPPKLKCPECESRHLTFNNLEKHLAEVHNINLDNLETKFFEFPTDFHKWKGELEKEERVIFAIRSSTDQTTYYRCSGSGGSQRSETPSVKTRSTCPARIVLRKMPDGFIAEFQGRHMGHMQSITENSTQVAGNGVAERCKEKVQVDKRNKLKTLLDTIFVLSEDVDESQLNNICNGAEQLLKQVKSLGKRPSDLRCTSDMASRTTGPPANKKIKNQQFYSVRKRVASNRILKKLDVSVKPK